VYKTWDNFHAHSECPHGKNTTCIDCRKPLSKQQWKSKDIVKKILQRAKSRAVLRDRDFDIDESDIVIPDICPVLKIPMVQPSIDRIDNSKGYVKGNVRIISNRANTLKNNAEIWELKLILEDMENHE
jgi:hypothetical protein